MAYANGKFPQSALGSIPGGFLSKDAAAAWNAPGGPADSGLRITGPNSGYRTYEKQVEYYNLYLNGGNLAAVPGTSNHGWGNAVDLAEPWMADWMRDHGAKFGFKKIEAFSEWWHFNYVGGFTPKKLFKSLHGGEKRSKGPRVWKITRKLAYIKGERGRKYLDHKYWRFKDPVIEGVKQFQKQYGLTPDGVIGPKTWGQIERVFKRQWKANHR